MNNRERFFSKLAKKLSNRLGKPSSVITVMAFLFIFMVIGLIANVPMTVYLAVNMTVLGFTLLMVLLMQNIHGQDIRALQARIDELATERRQASEPVAGTLTEGELQQVRDLLQRSDNDDSKRRPDRDRRPSLF
jgi:low affinity Fe/Cu permease